MVKAPKGGGPGDEIARWPGIETEKEKSYCTGERRECYNTTRPRSRAVPNQGGRPQLAFTSTGDFARAVFCFTTIKQREMGGRRRGRFGLLQTRGTGESGSCRLSPIGKKVLHIGSQFELLPSKSNKQNGRSEEKKRGKCKKREQEEMKAEKISDHNTGPRELPRGVDSEVKKKELALKGKPYLPKVSVKIRWKKEENANVTTYLSKASLPCAGSEMLVGRSCEGQTVAQSSKQPVAIK